MIFTPAGCAAAMYWTRSCRRRRTAPKPTGSSMRSCARASSGTRAGRPTAPLPAASPPPADCLILGCTEVGLLLNADNVDLPVFDTVDCHVEAAVAASLDGT